MSRQIKKKTLKKVDNAKKQINEKISLTEEQYRIIADYTYDWEYWLTPEGNFIYNSPSCKRISGRDPQDFINNPELFRNIIHPDDLKIWIDHRHNSVLGKQTTSIDFRIINKDGTIRWIEHFCNPVVDAQGKFIGTRSSNRDITSRKIKIENTLHESEEKLKLAELIGKIGHWEYDILNNSIYWSEETFRLYERDKNLGPPSEKEEAGYYSKETTKSLRNHTTKIIETGKPIEHFTFQVILPSRRFAIFETCMHPVKDESGKIIKIFGTVQDITERKQAEESLKKSEFRLNRSEIISRLGNFEIDLKTRIVTGSLSAKKIYGLEGTYRQLSDLQKLTLGEYREYLDNALKNLIEKNIPYNVEFRIKKYDTGEILDIHSIAEYDKVNKIVYGIVQDITDRKHAEQKLRESEEQFRRLFMSINEGFYLSEIIYDKNGNPYDYKYLEVNPKFEEIMGLSRDKIIGRTYRELVPVDTTEWLDNYIKVARTGVSSYYDFYSKEYNMYFSTYSYKTTKNQVTVFVMNITERKKAEEYLKASEERFRKLVQSVTDYIYTVKVENGKAVSTYHGPACLSVTGYTSEEFSKDQFLWYNIIHEDDRNSIIEITDKITKGESVSAFEHRIVHKSDTIRWVRNTPVVRRNDKGEVIEYDGLITDITEKKVVEEKIIKLNLELEARVHERTMELELANKELEAFSYSVSHDLKSPLRAISGFTDLAMEKIDNKESELLVYVKNITLASDKMSKLIDDLLNLSKITQKEINKSTFDISELIKKIFDEQCRQYPNFKIDFNYQKNLIITADLNLVTIMLKNLVDNALKYSSKKSKIKIEFGSILKNEKLSFFIKDKGTGFDMKYADRLFAPFQRLHSDKEFEGTGIGLAIVHRIIKKHGGNVWIESKKGTGTTIFFNL